MKLCWTCCDKFRIGRSKLIECIIRVVWTMNEAKVKSLRSCTRIYILSHSDEATGSWARVGNETSAHKHACLHCAHNQAQRSLCSKAWQNLNVSELHKCFQSHHHTSTIKYNPNVSNTNASQRIIYTQILQKYMFVLFYNIKWVRARALKKNKCK